MFEELSNNSHLHYLSLVNWGLTLDKDRTVLAELPAFTSNLPAMWVSHLRDGSSGPGESFCLMADTTGAEMTGPRWALPNCRFLRKINYCCLVKPWSFGVVCYVSVDLFITCPLAFWPKSWILILKCQDLNHGSSIKYLYDLRRVI